MFCLSRPIDDCPMKSALSPWLTHPLLLVILAIALGITAALAIMHANTSELLRRFVVLQLRDSLQRDVSLQHVQINANGHVLLTGLVVKDSTTSRHPLFSARQVEVEINVARLLASPALPMATIRKVTLDHPFVYLARNTGGVWNVDDLLKQKPSKDKFRGELVVRDGEVLYDDALGWLGKRQAVHEHLVHLSAHLTQAGDDYVPFQASAQVTSGDLRVFYVSGGIRPARQEMQCAVDGGDVDLAFIQRLLPKLPVTLSSGHADGRLQLSMSIVPHTGKLNWSMTVLADLRDARGTLFLHRKLPIVISQAQFRMTDDAIDIVGMHGSLDSVPVDVSGSITNFDTPIFSLQVKTTGAEAARVVKIIPGLADAPYIWRGPLDGWAQITGPSDAIQVIGHARGPSLQTTFGDYANIESDFAYDESTLALTHISAQGFGGQLGGSAWVSLATAQHPAVLLQGQADNVDLHDLLNRFSPPAQHTGESAQLVSLHDLRGRLTGPVTVRVAPDGNVAVLTQSRGQVEVGNLTQATVNAGLRLDITDRRTDMLIDRLDAQTPEGRFQLQGRVSTTDGLRLTVRGSDVSLSALAAHAKRTDITGSGFVRGDITGTIDQPHFAGTIHAVNGSVAGRQFTRLASDISVSLGATPKASLQKIVLVAGDNQLELSGLEISDLKQLTWAPTGTLRLRPTTLQALQAIAGVNFPLNGGVEGVVQFTGASADPSGTVVLQHPWLTIGNSRVEFDRATVHFTLQKQLLDITTAELLYKGAPIIVSGSLPLERTTSIPQALSLRVKANDLNLDDFTTLVAGDNAKTGHPTVDARLPLPVDVAGHFNLDLTLNGQLAPGKGETVAAVLARTIVAKGAVDGDGSFAIAGVPFQTAAINVEYHGDSRTVTMSQLELARADGGYHLSLASPGSLNLVTDEIDLRTVLAGADGAADKLPPADLDNLRRDVLTIAANTAKDYRALQAMNAPAVAAGNSSSTELNALPSPLTQVLQMVQAIPVPFAGKGAFKINLAGALRQPLVSTDLACTDLIISGIHAPDLAGSVAFDTAPRVITIERLTASGGPDSNATAELAGTITLPEKDADGNEVAPGPLNLSLNAQNINPTLLAPWLHTPWLKELRGEVTVVATVNSTTASPHVVASVDVVNPGYRDMQFDTLSAIVSVDEEGIWLGRWVKAASKEEIATLADGGHDGAQPVVIDNKMIYSDAGATLQFKGADKAPIEPLEVIGHVPFRWKGPLVPYVPSNEPIFFACRLPKQGLDVVKSYLPQPPTTNGVDAPANAQLLCALPQGKDWANAFRIYLTKAPQQAGTIEGSLEVHGTLDTPQIANGTFRLQAPELLLSAADEDLPNRMRNTVVDIGFSSLSSNNQVNIVKVNDLSTIFDRSASKPITVKNGNFITRLFGKKSTIIPPAEGALVMQGAIQIDLNRLRDAQHKLLPTNKLLNQLDYDLYAKTLRTPLRWRDLFKGTVTGYARLSNSLQEPHRPLLTGVVYLEKARLMYSDATAPAGEFELPFDPELSLAVQIGPDNRFDSGSTGPVSTDFAFMPTTLFPPFSQADLTFTQTGAAGKPAVERDHPAYRYTENTLEAYGGSHGSVVGTLVKPVLTADFALVPGQSELRFPGGTLTVDEGRGDIRFSPGSPFRLYVKRGYATGLVDAYKVAATIDNADLFQQANGRLPVKFTTVSAPPNMPMLSNDDITLRLVGIGDIADALQGKQQPWAPIYHFGDQLLLQGPLAQIARKMGLQSFTFHMRPGQFPEASLTTQEFGKSRWSAFRFGTSRVLSNPPTWQVWLDYRLPDNRFLRNFSITGNMNELHEMGANLQYQWEF